MRRCKIVIQYDGSNYCGFQVQPQLDCVESRINGALTQAIGEPIKVVACSRTDSGVHAYGLVMHADVSRDDFPVDRLPFITPSILPGDIVVTTAEWVSDDFHARYSVVDKTYEYKVILSSLSTAFEYNRAYFYKHKIDIDAMKIAACELVGEHDFRAFMSSGSSVKSTVRNIKELNIVVNGNIITFEITANGFLYNMVRIIVGTLLDVARGYLPATAIANMLLSGDRARGGHTAPPQGLYLRSVQY